MPQIWVGRTTVNGGEKKGWPNEFLAPHMNARKFQSRE